MSALGIVPLADGASGDPTHLSWNLVTDFQQLWQYPFMVNAFRAGTVIALAAAAIGYFVVVRRQSFVTHTLASVGFPGATGATLLGLSAPLGYFGFCLGAALAIAGLAARRRADLAENSAVTATVLVTMLGLGFLFAHLYQGDVNGVSAVLFGTFLGVSDDQVLLLVIVSAVVLAVLCAIGRPLLFASLDPALAGARGVPIAALSTTFLVLLGAAVAEASQITGTLLVFALLIMPAATARRLTSRTGLGLLLSALIGLVVTWFGLALAYFSPYPLGFYVTSIAFALYLFSALPGRSRARRPAAVVA
jgi:zinc/manganese transport system permease protein